MKYLKQCICFMYAVKDLLIHGIWVPHVFKDTYEKAIIISTDHGFRVSQDYQHVRGELVHKDAYLIRSRCIYCGKEELSWAEDSRFLDREETDAAASGEWGEVKDA